MALQPYLNAIGRLLTPFSRITDDGTIATENTTLDAAGESQTGIGQLIWSSGPGTTKTISSSGGKVFVRFGALTFNNAGSTFRLGVQDVGATGLEDGTFDAFAELIGGGGGITASAVNALAITSGSKSITHGDLIAISSELIARGGADSLIVLRGGTSVSLPYTSVDTGSGPGKNIRPPLLAIQADDGTLGWLWLPPLFTENSAQFSTSSTPDEHALVFRVPFRTAAVGLHAKLSNLAATDDFELILYSDPLGTPTAQRTITQDMDLGAVGAAFDGFFTSAYTLEPDTDYAIALRPTTTNALSYLRVNLGSGNGDLRLATPFGTDGYLATRSDQTGAFGSADTTILPQFGVWLGQLEDGAGGGGGGTGGAHILGGTVVR